MAFIQPEGLTRGTHDFTSKLQNRFLFSFEEDPTTKLLVRSASRPSITFNEVRIPHINKWRYEKGKGEYDPLNITLLDYVTPSSAQTVMEWLTFHSEMYTGRDGYPSFYRKTCTLETLGPTNDVVERWDYLNCFITSADFGQMDWETDQQVEINLTIRYDDVLLRF